MWLTQNCNFIDKHHPLFHYDKMINSILNEVKKVRNEDTKNTDNKMPFFPIKLNRKNRESEMDK